MWQLIKQTLVTAYRKRLWALAAEVAFFGFLSIPPLLVGALATAGLVTFLEGEEAIDSVTEALIDGASRIFNAQTVEQVVRPSVEAIVSKPQITALSLGYVVAAWSGSRMVNALFESIEILTNKHFGRSFIHRRMRALKAVVVGFVGVGLVLPFLIVAPQLIRTFLPWSFQLASWFLVSLIGLFAAVLLLRNGDPKPPWSRTFVVGVFVLLAWVVVSSGLQWWLSHAASGIYGPLSAPIAVMLWLQLMAAIFLLATIYLDLSGGPYWD